MVNEELIGGLISALSRGEPLQKAMMTFYNAGYGKQEIEEAAKTVYSQVGAQTAKTGYLKESVKTIAPKVGLVKKNIVNKVPVQPQTLKPIQKPVQKPIQEKKPEKEEPGKDKDKSSQKVSIYGDGQSYGDANQITSKLERAIKDLSQIKFPRKIRIINETVNSGQRVSNYSNDGLPKPISKTITYLLVFILILLFGTLVAVFFFKEDLIRIFNSFGFG